MLPYLRNIDDYWQPDQLATLGFVCHVQKVMLIHKKRGLGAGKINGPGGKCEPGESPEACMVRELYEETGVVCQTYSTHGRLRFAFADGYTLDVAVFCVSAWSGEPIETDEAKPFWADIAALPLGDMWADDRIWLPRVLSGASVQGRFCFDEDRLLAAEVVFT